MFEGSLFAFFSTSFERIAMKDYSLAQIFYFTYVLLIKNFIKFFNVEANSTDILQDIIKCNK